MATFLLSGFQAQTSTKTLTPPASDAIRKLQLGANTGQVNITPMRYKGSTPTTSAGLPSRRVARLRTGWVRPSPA
jgi:hypothetical protein